MRQNIAFVPLSRDEEKKLIIRWKQNKDKRALEILVNSCEGLLHRCVRKHASPNNDLYNSLLQQGKIGLIIGANKFDLDQNVRFATYAMWWAKALIKRERYPRNDPPAQTISIFTKIGPDKSDSGAMAILDTIEDKTFHPEFVLGLKGAVDNDLIRQVVNSTLSDRDRQIIEWRYFTDEGLTLEEVGDKLGLSRERVRQLEAVILIRLRNRLESWDDHLEYVRKIREGQAPVRLPTNFHQLPTPISEENMENMERILIETITKLGGKELWIKSADIVDEIIGLPGFGGVNSLVVGHACGKLANEGKLARLIRNPVRYYGLPGIKAPLNGERIKSVKRDEGAIERPTPPKPHATALSTEQTGRSTQLSPAALAVRVLGLSDRIAGMAIKLKGVSDILKTVDPDLREGFLQAAKLLAENQDLG